MHEHEPSPIARIVTALAVLALGAGLPDAAAWTIEDVDTGRLISSGSMRLDPAGNPTVVYGEDGLHLAVRVSGAWSATTIVPGACLGRDVSPSLRFDPSGNPAVSFYHGGERSLQFARFDGSAWSVETVTTSGDRGRYSSLAFDDTGRPAISYFASDSSALEVARWTGSFWAFDVVAPSAGQASSIGFAPDGRWMVTYHKEATFSGDVWIARFGGATWGHERVDPETASENVTALAFDADGWPAVAIGMNGGSTKAKLARYDGSVWTVDTIAPFTSALAVALAFDPGGLPHVAYSDWSNRDVRYATWDGAWTIRVADTVVSAPPTVALELGADGVPTILYTIRGGLSLAEWLDDTYWEIADVDRELMVGEAPSLAFDPAGAPWVSHRASDNATRVTHWNGSGWETEVVSADDRVAGTGTAIAFDPAGEPAVAYFLSGRGDPILVRHAGSVWAREVVEEADFHFDHVDLLFDDGGGPVLAYWEQKRHDLKYARQVGGVWTSETVAALGRVGEHLSLALDPTTGQPAISYSNATLVEVQLARLAGGVWRTETVASALTDGTSLAFDLDGNPLVSYYDDFERALYLAEWTGSTWDMRLVDDTAGVGRSSSLAVDPAGNPLISYYDVTNDALKLARWDGGGFAVETVDAGGVGVTSSLVIDRDGDPAIAYQAHCLGDVRLARDRTPSFIHRGIVTSFAPGWQAAALPLTSLNDDEAGPFPASADGPGPVAETPPAAALVLYRILGDGDRALSRTLKLAPAAGDIAIHW